ncbi:MAG: branched-chain amino acid aminotransferase [Cellvibrionales bacterium]|nr:branched-chain amino acid aminotransferase [Cellvibrionales bacterium]
MPRYQIHPAVAAELANFTLPAKLDFGGLKLPIMYRADYRDEAWQPAELTPYGTIELDPAAKVLHYAQEIFEGLKAYCVGTRRANFFRPLENLARMNRSAERMGMVQIPESVFMDGIGLVAGFGEPFIPRRSGESLYLRPFLFGTRATLGMGASDSFTFMVISSPSAIYHAGHMRVWVERDACRAARGGTGAAKTGGNYAAALKPARRAQQRGFHQSLWLDPRTMEHIEELSGMNIFALIDGTLHTPRLTDSLLAGITRDSLIHLARHRGLDVIERDMPIADLLAGIEAGTVSELFACGTAAIVSPISVLADGETEYRLPQVDQVAAELRTALLAIQERRAPDPFDWTMELDPRYYPPSPQATADAAAG